jgi:hypothetical protein
MSERDETRSYHFGYFHPQTSRLTIKKPAENGPIRLFKPRVESSTFQEERTIRHVTTNSYFYDERGKIKLNPFPLKVAFCSHTFHEYPSSTAQDPENKADRSFDDSLHKRSRTAYKKHERKRASMEPKVPTSHGSRGTWHRELFIMQDGTIISESSAPSGFKYILSYKKNQTRKKLQQEFQDFLLYATQKFKCSDKFRFAFSKDGKILHSLYELPQGQSVAFVGHSRYFKGFYIDSSESATYRSKGSIKSRERDTPFDGPNYKSHEKSRGRSVSSVQSCNPNLRSEAKIGDEADTKSKTQIVSHPTPIESDHLEDIIRQYSSNDRTFTEIAPRKVYSAVSSLSPDRNRAQINQMPISDYQNRIIQKVICKMASKTVDIYKASVKLRNRLAENLIKVDRLHPHLTKSSIQQLEARYKFSRADIHKLYARFKTLLLVAVALNPDYGKIYCRYLYRNR